MSSHKQKLGRWGEQLAAKHLQAKGYRIVEHNARTEHGEIDLVAQLGEEWVFVEVKTRSTLAFGHPEEAITLAKQEHMLASAEAYLQTLDTDTAPWRVDVIAVHGSLNSPEPEILHIENALA